jgi:hypothetical protein
MPNMSEIKEAEAFVNNLGKKVKPREYKSLAAPKKVAVQPLLLKSLPSKFSNEKDPEKLATIVALKHVIGTESFNNSTNSTFMNKFRKANQGTQNSVVEYFSTLNGRTLTASFKSLMTESAKNENLKASLNRVMSQSSSSSSSSNLSGTALSVEENISKTKTPRSFKSAVKQVIPLAGRAAEKPKNGNQRKIFENTLTVNQILNAIPFKKGIFNNINKLKAAVSKARNYNKYNFSQNKLKEFLKLQTQSNLPTLGSSLMGLPEAANTAPPNSKQSTNKGSTLGSTLKKQEENVARRNKELSALAARQEKIKKELKKLNFFEGNTPESILKRLKAAGLKNIKIKNIHNIYGGNNTNFRLGNLLTNAGKDFLARNLGKVEARVNNKGQVIPPSNIKIPEYERQTFSKVKAKVGGENPLIKKFKNRIEGATTPEALEGVKRNIERVWGKTRNSNLARYRNEYLAAIKQKQKKKPPPPIIGGAAGRGQKKTATEMKRNGGMGKRTNEGRAAGIYRNPIV